MNVPKATFAAVLIGLTLSGAAQAKKKPEVPEPPIDISTFEWSRVPGINAVSGDAMLRTRGGEVRTCAGLWVKLLPVAPYSDALIARRQKVISTLGGLFQPVVFGKSKYFERGRGLDIANKYRRNFMIVPEVEPYVRETTCTSQGMFSFSGLPDGSYYILADVNWWVPTRSGGEMQGGELVQRVELQGGAEKKVTVTSH